MRVRQLAGALTRGAGAPLLIVSAFGWFGVACVGRVAGIPPLCAVPGAVLDWNAWSLFFAFNLPSSLLLSWLAMLLAMMPPLLIQPLTHIWSRSFRRRRWRTLAAFVLGNAGLWTAIGAVLTVAAIALKFLAGSMAFYGAIALAVVWQASPIKQACINRCHRAPSLSAFGFAADRDGFSYGVSFAFWCAGACWPLMLLPLVADRAHIAVMIVVWLVMVVERLGAARAPKWRAPWSGLRLLWA